MSRTRRTESSGPPDVMRECGHCGKSRPVERIGESRTYPCPNCGAISAWFCQSCGARSASTPTIPTSVGLRVCSTCLATAYSPGDATSRCTELGCTKTAAEHIVECRQAMANLQVRLLRRAERLRTPPSDETLDRPAAVWTDDERASRAQDQLRAYREHLAKQGEESPF